MAGLELEKLLVEDGDPRPAAGVIRRGRRRKRLGPTMDNDKKEMPDNPTGESMQDLSVMNDNEMHDLHYQRFMRSLTR